MSADVLSSRFFKVAGVTAALALVVTACGGGDLGKSNYPRTTVAAANADTTPSGPITDPAVASEALRLVQPCQFVDKTALASLGTVTDEPSPSSVAFDQCRNGVKDPGGKEIRFTVKVGGAVSFATSNNMAGSIGGLPLVVVKGTDTSSCDVSALTSRELKLGVTFTVMYNGGDACRAGQTALDGALKKLHESPAKYSAPTGSLLTADPCTMLDTSAIDAAGVKSATRLTTTLHSCVWGLSPTATVTLAPNLAPAEGDGFVKVDLGGGLTAYQKASTTSADCRVQWKHREWQGKQVEVAQVQFTDVGGSSGKDAACGKAVGLAKNLAQKLPKA
ncbi:hypothetical protein [Amycolatopsis samaneae]|uniref:DUF3558 domain-containing protein n=1 Tax=Amycolatopsis samaneae TaxID=664691 RepID=A0ABW5GM11_9PSEU